MMLTREIIDAAETAYDARASDPCSRDALEVALEVAATHLIRQAPATAPEGGPAPLGYAEALEKAEAIVASWSGSGTSAGTRTPMGGGSPLADRTAAVLRLASFLTGRGAV